MVSYRKVDYNKGSLEEALLWCGAYAPLNQTGKNKKKKKKNFNKSLAVS